MATNTPASNTAAAQEKDATAFDRKDLSRIFARLRHEVGGLVDDATRRSPFYARSKEEAVAKRNAAVRTLEEFADRIDVLKKENG